MCGAMHAQDDHWPLLMQNKVSLEHKQCFQKISPLNQENRKLRLYSHAENDVSLALNPKIYALFQVD